MTSRLLTTIVVSLILAILTIDSVSAVEPDFSSKSVFATGSDNTFAVAVGDMDGDGDLDIVTGNSRQDVVYLNDGAGNFTSLRNFGTGSDITLSVAVGDMDGDGDLDIVTGTGRQQNAVYLNDGAGNFASVRNFGSGSDDTYAVAAADMDGDGDLDIVTGNSWQWQQDAVYFNDGAGNFASMRNFGTGAGMVVGDMDEDGDLDIVTNSGQQNVVHLNDGAGTFTSGHDFGTGSALAAGDLDGDGDLDIVIENGGQGAIYLNDGTGNFTSLRNFGTGSDYISSVAVGDMDGDGDLDIVAGNKGQQDVVYLNDGAANFTSVRNFGTGSDYTYDVAVGDMDGDGDLDIVTGSGVDLAYGVGRQDMVYFNSGSGSFTSVRNFGTGSDYTSSVAVGDMDGDGDLDIVASNSGQQDVVYLNDGSGNFTSVRTFGTGSDHTACIAIGDMDGDGDLDIVAGTRGAVVYGTGEQNVVYLNDGAANFTSGRNFGTGSDGISSIAVGDMNGDGDLDIVVGDMQQDFVYLNDGTGNFMSIRTFGTGLDHTSSIALGDMDGDNDLDIVSGNWGNILNNAGEQNVVYLNDGTGNFTSGRNFGTGSDGTTSVTVGDMDADSHLDIIIGNTGTVAYGAGQQNVVYLNDGAGNFTSGRNFGTGSDKTYSTAVGDMDGDGDLDIVAGNVQQDFVYLNDGYGNFMSVRAFGSDLEGSSSLAVGDMDGDSDLDIIAGKHNLQSGVYLKEYMDSSTTRALLDRPITTPNANYYSSPVYLVDSHIHLHYRLVNDASISIGHVAVQYSFDGGGRWLPAIPSPGTQISNLATSSVGVEHVFTWDAYASGFFGQSDNVVLRLLIYPQSNQPAIPGTYRYVRSVAGPYQHAYYATQTFPFRVRGTQVRVLQGAEPQSSALVYRLPAGAERNGKLISGSTDPYRTSPQGFLSGRGPLGPGDRLLALVLVAQTGTYDVYYTSPTDHATGLPSYTVTQAGVQTLTVSADNPLVLFNLDVALEWDASKDTIYLTQLQYDLNRTSELLYNWTNGQAALGRIRIFHDARRQPAGQDGFQPWLDSHIRIYATNRMHPNAIQGGITPDRTVETTPNGKTISYTPGMVHIGAVWDRYAESSALGEDWPRALAHELGHYLFFLDDNYIGQANDGSMQFISADPTAGCPGVMNDPYTDFLAKFQPKQSWLPGCANTYSHQLLGRADWDTIATHYPWLKPPTTPIAQVNPGPSGLRLAFTQFEFVPPPDAPADQQTLGVPIFTIATADGSAYRPSSEARAFLLQGGRLIDLGAPALDQLYARGVRTGDTLYLLEPDGGHAGYVTAAPSVDRLVVKPVTDWKPQVIVTPINSRYLAIAVKGVNAGRSLRAQLYPRDGDATGSIELAPTADGYAGTFQLATEIFEGNLRIWDANDPFCQVLTDFVFGSNPERWDARDARWRARLARWRARFVPVIAAGGRVAVLGDNVAFGAEDWLFSLQTATALPNLPTWATPIGQSYWLHATANAPDLSGTAISFNYDRRDVPAGLDTSLRVFFWNGAAWTLLPTNVDPEQSLASAHTQGPGLYALVAAPEIPLQGPGWNNFAFTIIGDPSPVSTALASITGKFTIVYSYDPANQANPWRSFDPTAPSWANDLNYLEYGKAYWIYATQSTTLHPIGGAAIQAASGTAGGLLPPAVLYGVVERSAEFIPQPGMTVTAWVDGQRCGQAQTQALNDSVVYVMDVASDTDEGGCGTAGRTVRFTIGTQEVSTRAAWDDTRALQVTLSPTSPTPTPTETPVPTATPDSTFWQYLPNVQH